MLNCKEMIYKPQRTVEVLYKGEYKGYKFCIISLGTHPAAYVECKLENCFGYDDERLYLMDVHGGFTYYGEAYWDKSDKTTYIGWDYAHYGDFASCEIEMPDYLITNGKMWTTQEIYEEVISVINQLKPLEYKDCLRCKDCENWKTNTHFKKYKGKEVHICAEKDELTCEDDTCIYAKNKVMYNEQFRN